MSFYLKKEWIDQEDNINKVYIHYTITNINKPPLWRYAEKRELFIEYGLQRKARSKVIKLPRQLNKTDNYYLHYYFEIFKNGNQIPYHSDTYIDEIVSDDSFCYIDNNGEYTNICLYWSINGWGAPNYSAMFVDGITVDNPLSSLHFYKRSDDPEYLKGRFNLLKKIPLPHVFRGRAHGPKGSHIDYCYHIVSKTGDHDYGFWDNNHELNYHKKQLDKHMWQNLYGKDMPGHTITGNIKTIPQFYSPQLNNCRSIYIYLPPSYNKKQKRYPVIYMQDGQNLFDKALSFAGEWMVDESMEELAHEGFEAIIVGIENGKNKRILEYNPFSKDVTTGDHYINFIIHTLKPIIDKDFRTLSDKKNTGIIGSSLGALISLYAFFKHPDIFGFVGALSHWMWIKDNVSPDDTYSYIKNANINKGRIYLDIGINEVVGEDITGMPFNPEQALHETRRIITLLKEKGYKDDTDLMYVEVENGSHSEHDWAKRFPEVIRFLLHKE